MISNTPYIYIRAALAAAVAVSATLFAGCSSASDAADTPAVDAHAITFNATDGTTDAQESTRATAQVGLETLGYTEIKVYGYKTINNEIQNVMPGYTLKYVENSENSSTTNSSGWEYVGLGASYKDYLNNEQEIKYWDGNSTDYRFFGVIAARNSDLLYDGSAITENTVVTSNGSFSLEIKGLEYMTHTSDGTYHDRNGKEVKKNEIPMYGTLWQGDPAQYYNTPVPLAFTKPYALVRVVFERPEGTSKTQLGKEGETTHPITFAPLNGSSMTGDGKVDVSWSMTGSHETATATAGSTTLPNMTFDSPVNLVNQGVRYQAWPEYIMIPSTDDPVAFKCTAYTYTVNTSGGEVFEARSAVVPAQYMKWKPGYQYTYVFKITATNAMEFSHVVEVYTQWQAGYVDTTTW